MDDWKYLVSTNIDSQCSWKYKISAQIDSCVAGNSKYSYMGDILRLSPGPFDRANPFQTGVEYFGNITKKVDIEIIKLMIDAVLQTSMNTTYIFDRSLDPFATHCCASFSVP